MIRTSFKRPAYQRPARSPIAPATRRAVMTVCAAGAPTNPKESPVRSEPYRRLVAMLDCAYCGIGGLSQAAHPPPTGKGIKEDDRECFPMCCTRPGAPGCHFLFDQGKLMSRTRMRVWAAAVAADTRSLIEGNGMWPKGLEKYPRKEPVAA